MKEWFYHRSLSCTRARPGRDSFIFQFKRLNSSTKKDLEFVSHDPIGNRGFFRAFRP